MNTKRLQYMLNKAFCLLWIAIALFSVVAILFMGAWWHLLSLLIATVMAATIMPKKWREKLKKIMK